MIHKNITIPLICLTLTACGGAGGGITPPPSTLAVVDANKTSGTYTSSIDNKVVSANLTFRASTAYLNGGSYVKVNGHEVKTSYGKTEVGTPTNVTSFVKNAGAFEGILSSPTVSGSLTTLEATFTSGQRTTLDGLRASISTLETQILGGGTPTQLGAWKVELRGKYEALATLVSYGDLQVSVRSIASGKAYYGLFINKESGNYKQISAIYAKADGVADVDYATLVGTPNATYNSKFKGAAVANNKLTDLTGSGVISANFSTNALNGNFNLSNKTNRETGSLAISGTMGANTNGVVMSNTNATYTKTTGELNSMTGGYTEAALFDGGNVIAGSVNFTNGDQALVGAFAGEK